MSKSNPNIVPITLLGIGFVLTRSILRKVRRDARNSNNTNDKIDFESDYETGYENGIPFNIKVTTIDSKLVEVNTAAQFIKMKNAALKNGITLKITQGFRTFKEQEYFYNCYITKKCNNGNKAAKPGFSNHQNGKALDIILGNEQQEGKIYKWLVENASLFGFYQTIEEEPWHWVWGVKQENI